VSSPTYDQFVKAMVERKQILCMYGGFHREICPVILGLNKDNDEVALTYQFAGGSSGKNGLPLQGAWKCLHLSEVSDVRLRSGPWHAGASHSKANSCVKAVDLDVNPASPYNPKRSLSDLV
jgi:hypothetical protein